MCDALHKKLFVFQFPTKNYFINENGRTTNSQLLVSIREKYLEFGEIQLLSRIIVVMIK